MHDPFNNIIEWIGIFDNVHTTPYHIITYQSYRIVIAFMLMEWVEWNATH
jgi:hypothetical protein